MGTHAKPGGPEPQVRTGASSSLPRQHPVRQQLAADAGGGTNANPTKPLKTPAKGPAAQAAPPKAGKPHSARIVSGGAKVITGGVKGSGDTKGIAAIFVFIAVIVGLAIFRGQNINKGAAVFAWFLLFFVCAGLAMINKGLGYSVAILLLIQALLEFGPSAFNGLLQGKPAAQTSTTSNEIQTVGSGSSDVTAAILAYIGLKAGSQAISNLGNGGTTIVDDNNGSKSGGSSEEEESGGESGLEGDLEGLGGDFAEVGGTALEGVEGLATGGASD